ncbi:MAG: rhodanese-like domain-containing protein, partial [Bacteroidota bacterium]
VKQISLPAIPAHLNEIEDLKDREVVVICRSGGRSGQAKMFLSQKGFSNVRNLEGGMLAWKAAIDPTFDVD